MQLVYRIPSLLGGSQRHKLTVREILTLQKADSQQSTLSDEGRKVKTIILEVEEVTFIGNAAANTFAKGYEAFKGQQKSRKNEALQRLR